MNFFEARQAVKQFVTDNWTATPVIWPNPTRAGKGPPKQITDASPHWIALEMEDLRPEMGLGGEGNRYAEDDGRLMAYCFAPVMTGDDAIYQTATDFGEFLRGQLMNGLQFYSPMVDSGQRADDDGAWFVVTVSIAWKLLRTV